jgi:hypothetical protein
MLCKYINQFFELKVAKSNISINNSRNKMNKKQQLNTKNSDDIIILVEKSLDLKTRISGLSKLWNSKR